ncbi:MAG: hypothetical protein ABIJ34_08675 [archaeon]
MANKLIDFSSSVVPAHFSELERMLQASGVDSVNILVVSEPLPGFSTRRSYSFATHQGSRELAYHLKELGKEAPVLIVIEDKRDGSQHIQQKLKGAALDHLLDRINFKSKYIPLPIQRLRRQLAHTKKIMLSAVEDSIYHLQVHNNLVDGVANSFGFPGAWMLHYNPNPKFGFYVMKIEPIPILEQCFTCPYGLFENIQQATGNYEGVEAMIAKSMRVDAESSRRQPPELCPRQWIPDTVMPLYAEGQPDPCPRFFGKPPVYGGEVYKDRFASIRVPLTGLRFEAQEIPFGQSEMAPMNIVVPQGKLRMRPGDKLFVGKPFWIY